MRDEQRVHFDRALAKAQQDPAMAIDLGHCLLIGIEEIEFHERLTGENIRNIYHTHFALNGSDWCLQLQRGSAPDAR